MIGFDGRPWASAISPAIAFIARPVDELGRQAVDKLPAHISDGKVSESVVLPTELIIRDSVRKTSVNK